jgi:hypothetical protein
LDIADALLACTDRTMYGEPVMTQESA